MLNRIEAYLKENKTTLHAFGKMIGIRGEYISFLRRDQRISRKAWQKLNNFFGCDIPYPFIDRAFCAPPPIPLPDWVKSVPRKIRPYVEQEYFVNEERAKYFADNAKTYEDIKALRRQSWQTSGYSNESTIMEMENII